MRALRIVIMDIADAMDMVDIMNMRYNDNIIVIMIDAEAAEQI